LTARRLGRGLDVAVAVELVELAVEEERERGRPVDGGEAGGGDDARDLADAASERELGRRAVLKVQVDAAHARESRADGGRVGSRGRRRGRPPAATLQRGLDDVENRLGVRARSEASLARRVEDLAELGCKLLGEVDAREVQGDAGAGGGTAPLLGLGLLLRVSVTLAGRFVLSERLEAQTGRNREDLGLKLQAVPVGPLAVPGVDVAAAALDGAQGRAASASADAGADALADLVGELAVESLDPVWRGDASRRARGDG
jgi:hypothetical protein